MSHTQNGEIDLPLFEELGQTSRNLEDLGSEAQESRDVCPNSPKNGKSIFLVFAHEHACYGRRDDRDDNPEVRKIILSFALQRDDSSYILPTTIPRMEMGISGARLAGTRFPWPRKRGISVARLAGTKFLWPCNMGISRAGLAKTRFPWPCKIDISGARLVGMAGIVILSFDTIILGLVSCEDD